MFSYIFNCLNRFRPAFSRQCPWLLFSAIVLCFMMTPEMIGVTSICRFWLLGHSSYHRLLQFFRSKAYCYDALLKVWHRYILSEDKTVEVAQRCILLGDHTLVPKDGRYMPGVTTLHDASETQTKPSYFRGHCWGACGLVIGSMSACFCCPLQLQIHLGFRHLGMDNEKGDLPNMGERIVQMAIDFSYNNDRPSIYVLDAFFPTGPVFNLARSVYSVVLKQPYVEILVRAKKNYVAYFSPEPKPKSRHGRQAKYGPKVHLMACFDQLHLFHKADCQIYGKTESVQMMAAKLLWKPIGDYILFIFAITSRGPIILMSSALDFCPIKAIELYCIRTRIEIMFDVLKNVLGAFCYHFWTKKVPRHSRVPVSKKVLEMPQSAQLATVRSCWQAYEVFVLCAVIAQGLLQLLSLTFSELIWEKHILYLRTRSRYLPSEKTVKQLLNQLFVRQLFHLRQNGMIQEIQRYFLRSYDKNAKEAHYF